MVWTTNEGVAGSKVLVALIASCEFIARLGRDQLSSESANRISERQASIGVCLSKPLHNVSSIHHPVAAAIMDLAGIMVDAFAAEAQRSSLVFQSHSGFCMGLN